MDKYNVDSLFVTVHYMDRSNGRLQNLDFWVNATVKSEEELPVWLMLYPLFETPYDRLLSHEVE